MQNKKISNKIIFISLTFLTFLLYWYGKEIANYFDSKWLVKYPKHYSFPFAIYTTTFVKWLINEANFWLFTFNDLTQTNKKNYISFKGSFIVKENNVENKLEPELRVYNQPNIITSEADIKTTFLTDKFITMNSVQNEKYFNIRYQVKPFMLWIWISVIIIILGGLKSLFKKKYEK